MEEPLLSTVEYTWGYADRNTCSIAIRFGAECHEVEMVVEKLKRHKSPGNSEIRPELIKAGGRTIRFGVHQLNTFVWNKEKLPEEWKESIIVPIYKKGFGET